MSRKVALEVIVLVLIALILVLKYYNVITLKQFALITQKRYMRSDKMLLTEWGQGQQSVTVAYTSEQKLSSVYAVISIDIEGTKYDCSPKLSPRYGNADLFVNITYKELSSTQLAVTFTVKVYSQEKLINSSLLETFETEKFPYPLTLEASSWHIYFIYDFEVYDYSFSFEFYYGNYGGAHSYIDGITFYIPEPKADFIYSPTTIYEGDEVVFDASVSKNSSKIVEYNWKIKKDTTIIYNINTTTPKMTYTFTKSGSYLVQLTITDEFNQTSSAEKSIQVLKVLLVDFSYTGKLYTYEYLTFQASVTTKYGIQKYIWNFGDGNINETKTNSTKHFYKNAGAFTATLTVIDAKGNQDSVSKVLNIKESTYKITASPFKVLKNVGTQIEISIYKNGEPYTYANIKVLSKDFSLTAKTDNQGIALFSVSFTERGLYTLEVLDSDYSVTLGNFSIFSTVEPLLEVRCEKQQFYNLIGQNDFLLTVILFDPDTYLPVTDYEQTVFLVSEGVEIPNEIYREDNRFIVTAKVFNIFNNTKERTINVFIVITSNTYYNTSFNTTVKMLAPIVDYWMCDSSGNPLPTNLKTGTQGFAIKLIKPEYLNVTKDNVYIEIHSPLGITTSNNLTLNISDDYIHVDYVFAEEGIYEITISIRNLPIFVPTRTYIYVVQSLATLDYISKYLQYAFVVAFIIMMIYLLKKRR